MASGPTINVATLRMADGEVYAVLFTAARKYDALVMVGVWAHDERLSFDEEAAAAMRELISQI